MTNLRVLMDFFEKDNRLKKAFGTKDSKQILGIEQFDTDIINMLIDWQNPTGPANQTTAEQIDSMTESDYWNTWLEAIAKTEGSQTHRGRVYINSVHASYQKECLNPLMRPSNQFLSLNTGSFSPYTWNQMVTNDFNQTMQANPDLFFLATSGINIKHRDGFFIDQLLKYANQDRGLIFAFDAPSGLHFTSRTYSTEECALVDGSFDEAHKLKQTLRETHKFNKTETYFLLQGFYLEKIVKQGIQVTSLNDYHTID